MIAKDSRLGRHIVPALTLRDNQPTVLEEVEESFHSDCLRPYTTVDCGHGRIETRSIRVSDELDPQVPYVSFPGVRFVAQVRREVEYKKDGRQRKPETVYLLTSLPPEVATPQRLLQLNRDYWGIENRVHWVRDVAMGEDRSRVRKGSLPRLLAAFANLAISILPLLGTKNIQRRLLQLKMNPNAAVALLLGCPPPRGPPDRPVGPRAPAAARAVPVRPRECPSASCRAPAYSANSPHRRPSARLPHLQHVPSRCRARTLNLPAWD